VAFDNQKILERIHMANTSVFGVFATRGQVEDAIAQLRTAGFRSADISILLPENLGTKDIGVEKNTKAPEGAATGAGIGALAIPGIGPFIAAGPLVAMLAGVGVGATAGGLTGALVGFGIPEYEAKRYEGLVKSGKILLSVHSDNSDWARKAKNILENTGAEDIASASEAKGDYANADKPGMRAGS
jgi:hypothetical protein